MFKLTFPSGNDLTVNLWPLTILLLIACMISIGVRRKQLKRLISEFQTGKISEDFLVNCNRLKHIYWSKQTRKIYDMLCCMLGAVHLEQGDKGAFFQNINALKKISGDTKIMVLLLFMQFFSGEAHIIIYAEYENAEKTKTLREVIYEMSKSHPEINEHFKTKYEELKNSLSHKDAIKVLEDFVEMLPGDSSLS